MKSLPAVISESYEDRPAAVTGETGQREPTARGSEVPYKGRAENLRARTP